MQESEAAGLGFRPFGGAGLEQWVDIQHEALVSSCDELEVLGTETRKSEQVEMRQRVAGAGRLCSAGSSFICLASLSLTFPINNMRKLDFRLLSPRGHRPKLAHYLSLWILAFQVNMCYIIPSWAFGWKKLVSS